MASCSSRGSFSIARSCGTCSVAKIFPRTRKDGRPWWSSSVVSGRASARRRTVSRSAGTVRGCQRRRSHARTRIPASRGNTVAGVAAPALSLRGVRKSFGSLTAVDGIDLEVPSGICFGLLGPNGAGKSTTMRMLTAQAIADEGEIEVLGYPLPEQSKEARARSGVVPQQDNLDVELTTAQVLKVFSYLYRVPRAEREEAIERALAIANLADRRDAKVSELSGGMRRRLLIARGLAPRPQLLLLDEPTVGLDPQVRQELWSLIDQLRTEGVTVLMSTHYIEEAQRLADTVAVMAQGKIVARGTPGELVAEHAGREVVEVYGPPAKLRELEAGAQAEGHLTRRTGTSLAFLRAEDLNGGVPDGERRAATLEDAFVVLTGEEVA